MREDAENGIKPSASSLFGSSRISLQRTVARTPRIVIPREAPAGSASVQDLQRRPGNLLAQARGSRPLPDPLVRTPPTGACAAENLWGRDPARRLATSTGE